MNTEKKTGSYYTPLELIRFMVDYLDKENQNFTSVLEPSAGDGRFLSLLLPKTGYLQAIEIFEDKVEQIKQDYPDKKVEVKKVNFLDYALEEKVKYSLIIGNPPYINLKTMEAEDIEKAKQLCVQEGIPKAVMQNMWLAFVVGSVRLLRKDGGIFFVLPMEFLQVQYAEKLRLYLEGKFNTIHIISFEKAIFPEIEQDVCLVYLTNRKKEAAHILYEVYQGSINREPCSRNLIKKNKPLKKWSNAILKDEEISLLKEGERRYEKIGDIGEIAPGIVTGGNQYFILNQQQVEQYRCLEYTMPILQKSSFVSEGTLKIDDAVLTYIRDNNKPFYLLNLAKENCMECLPVELQKYLKWAGDEKVQEISLKKRYKCVNRTPWYGVPIVNKGDIVFFKRYHLLPKIFVNIANVHTTDAGYHIRLKDGYDAASLVFCFFNSMTLAQCEFNGRYYGGGVSELVPSEFKELVVPYRKIQKEDFEKLEGMFKEKETLEDIIRVVNSRTLMENFTEEEIKRFEEIRVQLIKRRRKN